MIKVVLIFNYYYFNLKTNTLIRDNNQFLLARKFEEEWKLVLAR